MDHLQINGVCQSLRPRNVPHPHPMKLFVSLRMTTPRAKNGFLLLVSGLNIPKKISFAVRSAASLRSRANRESGGGTEVALGRLRKEERG